MEPAAGQAPETLRIPNEATYAPFNLLDVVAAAPLASRLLLGATLPGRVIQLAALGVYTRSVVRDWSSRKGMRRVDFGAEFGADVDRLEEQPRTSREMEMRRLAQLLNRDFVTPGDDRREVARRANAALTDYLAGITGQRVETSDEIRTVSLAWLIFPFAQGTCDMLSGDVAVYRDAGIFMAHLIAHEFVHRKGYVKELHAQALAYLALRNSDDPELIQSARAERLYRQMRTLVGDDGDAYDHLLDGMDFRDELHDAFRALRPGSASVPAPVLDAMKRLYEARMRLTGQNGLSDYDRGFTNFLHTFRFSDTARQPAAHAGL